MGSRGIYTLIRTVLGKYELQLIFSGAIHHFISLIILPISSRLSSGPTGIDNTSSQAFPVSGKALRYCDGLEAG